MKTALGSFQANLTRVRLLGGIHASLSASTTSALDVSDLLRAQIVLLVSAFDTLIHEIARIGMLEAAAGTRLISDGFKRFQVSFDAVQGAARGAPLAWLDAEIRRRHGYLTFQMPDKVADAIRLVSNVEIWPTVALRVGRTAAELKDELRLIVERRNKIAHEADEDPSFPGVRWPIDAITTDRAIDFLELVGSAIVSSL